MESAQTVLKAELAALAKGLSIYSKILGNIEALLKQSEPAVKTAVAGVAASYKQAFESLKCS